MSKQTDWQPISDKLKVTLMTVTTSTYHPSIGIEGIERSEETFMYIALRHKSALNPLVGMKPQAALNLLEWLEQHKSELEELAHQ